MRTLIVSDLHLGSNSRVDVLRRPELRAPLLERLADIDRLVLLGDVLELRHGPLREAMAAARPFFEDLGRALGGTRARADGRQPRPRAGRTVAGARGGATDPGPLGLEQLIEPAEASPALGADRRVGAPARTRVAYPGLWVREDVYAMHGHYLDCHLTVPTLERLTVGAMSRLLGRPAEASTRSTTTRRWERRVRVARRGRARRPHRRGAERDGDGLGVARARWRQLRGRCRGGVRAAACGAACGSRRSCAGARSWRASRWLSRRSTAPASVPSAPTSRAPSCVARGSRAMGEVAARLGLGDAHVVFGHTHRTGPLEADDEHEWRGRGGARLVNCGAGPTRHLPRLERARRTPTGRAGRCSSRTEPRTPRRRSSGCSRERSREELAPAGSAVASSRRPRASARRR